MKKILSIIGAIGLTATASTAVISCGTENKDNPISLENQKEKNIDDLVKEYNENLRVLNEFYDIDEDSITDKDQEKIYNALYNMNVLEYVFLFKNKEVKILDTDKPYEDITNENLIDLNEQEKNERIESLIKDNEDFIEETKDMIENPENSLEHPMSNELKDILKNMVNKTSNLIKDVKEILNNK